MCEYGSRIPLAFNISSCVFLHYDCLLPLIGVLQQWQTKALGLCTLGREIKYPYEDRLLRRVMEILDKDYHYRLYYIGRGYRANLE